MPRSDEVDTMIEEAGLDTLEYTKWGAYRLRLAKEDVKQNTEVIKKLTQIAYDLRTG
jgi:hypothetical protein